MQEKNIFPFLWMRGESEEVIRTEMEKISESNIRAVCLEARPHPDFAGEGWWHDVDIVLDEAKKRGDEDMDPGRRSFSDGAGKRTFAGKISGEGTEISVYTVRRDDRTSAQRAGRCGTSHKKTVYLDGLRKAAGEACTG